MDPGLPYWLTLAASALGGAGLTALVTVAAKVVDLRHRHDEVKREHYITAIEATDAIFDATLDAISARNFYLGALVREDYNVEVLQDKHDRALAAMMESLAVARRSLQILDLFAPRSVLAPAQALFDRSVEHAKLADVPVPQVPSDADQIVLPDWSDELAQKFRSALRADLGVDSAVRNRISRRQSS